MHDSSRAKTPRLASDLAIPERERDQLRLLGVGASGRDQRMLRGQTARGVGRGGVAGEVKSLAATATEIELSTLAALAGLGHPSLTAEGRKRGGVVPNLVQRALLHVVE